MGWIREQWRCIEVGLNDILYALKGLVAACSSGKGLLSFIQQIYTRVSDIPWRTRGIRCLHLSCWIPAWMNCLSTWLKAGCKEDLQDIELWAKISVEAEVQLSGSRCAHCKCSWATVILLFIFLCILLLVVSS